MREGGPGRVVKVMGCEDDGWRYQGRWVVRVMGCEGDGWRYQGRWVVRVMGGGIREDGL